MIMANKNIKPITNLDFDGIKQSLKEFLQSQTQFKDYNFEGSNMSVLLDLLAYNTFQNNFYTNMAVNEMFLDSAQIKNSVVSHAKELNYLPRSRKSAKAIVRVSITLQEPSNEQNILIPKFTEFSSFYDNDSYSFITSQPHIARKVGNGVYQTSDIEIFEGQMLKSFEREGYIVDADGTLRVYLSNPDVDTDSIVVYVDAEETEDQNIFVRADTVFGASPESKVFYIEPYFDDKYSIYFGRDIYGQQPLEFQDVRVEYRICSGAAPNGASIFNTSFLDGASISVNTVQPALGGAERESLESIKFNAPKSIQIQDRAITTNDYETLLRQRFPEIKAVSAYSGDELDPPQFGKVAISIYLENDTQLISSTLSNSYIEFLRQRTPLGIEPIFIQTQFVYAVLSVKLYYTSKLSEKTSDELEAMVRKEIQSYSETYLEEFDKVLRVSKLSSMLDELDVSIQSNSLEARPIIEYAPALNVSSNPSFKFETKLSKPYPFDESQGFSDYIPAIKSSVFRAYGACVYLQDDGRGSIQVVTDNITNPQIINPKAGTVDYEKGEVKLSNFVVESFAGSGIKLIANTFDRDIKAPKGRVFIIRDDDVTVDVYVEDTTKISTKT